jgi:hypothetical protein
MSMESMLGSVQLQLIQAPVDVSAKRWAEHLLVATNAPGQVRPN